MGVTNMETYRVYDTAWMRGQEGITYTGGALRVAMMIVATKAQAENHPQLTRVLARKRFVDTANR